MADIRCPKCGAIYSAEEIPHELVCYCNAKIKNVAKAE